MASHKEAKFKQIVCDAGPLSSSHRGSLAEPAAAQQHSYFSIYKLRPALLIN
jgi:hypothetical protein